MHHGEEALDIGRERVVIGEHEHALVVFLVRRERGLEEEHGLTRSSMTAQVNTLCADLAR